MTLIVLHLGLKGQSNIQQDAENEGSALFQGKILVTAKILRKQFPLLISPQMDFISSLLVRAATAAAI